jgi:transcriptional regulator with XRE-family HTH domain
MLTGAQIRSARAALGWSAQDLADKAGVTSKTIMRLESVDGIPQSRTGTLLDIKAALETAGIEFVGSPTNRPGIRFVMPRRPSE